MVRRRSTRPFVFVSLSAPFAGWRRPATFVTSRIFIREKCPPQVARCTVDSKDPGQSQEYAGVYDVEEVKALKSRLASNQELQDALGALEDKLRDEDNELRDKPNLLKAVQILRDVVDRGDVTLLGSPRPPEPTEPRSSKPSPRGAPFTAAGLLTLEELMERLMEMLRQGSYPSYAIYWFDPSGKLLWQDSSFRKSPVPSLDIGNVADVCVVGKPAGPGKITVWQIGAEPGGKFLAEKLETAWFSGIPERKKELLEWLRSTVLPLRVSGIDGLPDPRTPESGLVHFEGAFAEWLSKDQQSDKGFAIVVCGESGSGKSVLSCLVPKNEGFAVLHCSLTKDDVANKPSLVVNPCGVMIDELMSILQKSTRDFSSCEGPKLLQLLKSHLNKHRNDWALGAMKLALERRVPAKLRDWLDQGPFWQENENPDALAIVIDEATDVDLAAGLVDVARTMPYNRIAKRTRLVVCGAGLDALGDGQVGTDPGKERTVIVREPNLAGAALGAALQEAISAGAYSKVLATNARMLFRGVLPILQHPMHYRDADLIDKASRLKERLTALASDKDLMDYPVRLYISQNGICRRSESERDQLLQHAFVHHLSSSLASVQHSDFEKYMPSLLDGLAIENPAPNEVYAFGLANRKEKTSAALKYLSCFGRTSPTLTKDAVSFEETLILHLQRLYQCKGEKVKVATLQYAWPGPANADDAQLTAALIEKKMQKLDSQVAEETKHIKSQISSDTSCIIFRQSDSQAHGADILLAVQKSRTAWALDVIQCKNKRQLKSDDAKTVGIIKTNSSIWSCNPTEGSAGYSMAALSRLLSLMQATLPEAITVTLRYRALASSLPAADFVKKDKKTEFLTCPDLSVWCREFFDPTISIFHDHEDGKLR